MTIVDQDDGTLTLGGGDALTPGSVFAGRYVIEKTLGTGGMGSVHAALDRELGERVALKVLSAAGRIRAQTLDRFRREVRVARKVTHRNAVRTFDIGDHEGLHFLTMELIEGESLGTLLRREGPLPVERAVEIARQICEGLTAVHEADMVHRDLKPANVLLESTGRVVLTDFGVARPVDDRDGITRDRDMVGTPRYMAPEQIAGEPITVKADLYALGLVLYEMLTRRLPFEDDTPIAAAVARLQRAPEPPNRHVELSEPLNATVMACLLRDPSRRPASAAAVGSMLMQATMPAGTDDTMIASATSTVRHATPSSGASFASIELGDCCLAVLPLRYRGPAEDAYLAEALTEELVDLLSMTRGLRVPAAGACEPFADRRDPRLVREALGCDVVVDGTMQRQGSQLRVVVRLLDAHTGYQTWRERFDGVLEDVFELQDHIANRVAETLRLRVETRRFEFSAPEEAMELYMRARAHRRTFHLGGRGPDGAAGLLRRCLALAPDFPPALSLYAAVCAFMWFLYGERDEEFEWAAECERAVTRALEVGPGLPDTHLAAGRMHWQRSRFREGARAVRRALELAPTHAAAHAYLGVLQCEGGRGKEGIRHVELALELEPTRPAPRLTLARHAALVGDRERFETLTQQLWEEEPDSRFPVLIAQIRVASWDRDHASIRRLRDELARLDKPFPPFAQMTASWILGEATLAEVKENLDLNAPPERSSQRYRVMLETGLAEAHLARGEAEEAMVILERLAERDIVDLHWLDRCPLVDQLRGEPRLDRLRAKVRERVQVIWSAE